MSGARRSKGPRNDEFDVVIIGAGLAGLGAGKELRDHNPSLRILVVEAADYVGGRVKTLHNFCSSNVTVELGAELMHGHLTSVKLLADQCGFETREVFTWAQGDGGPTEHPVKGGIGMYYFGRERRMLRYDADDAEFRHLHEVLGRISELDVSKDQRLASMSMLDYLKSQKVSPRMIALAEAGYSNTLCGALRSMPVASTVAVERGWDDDGDHEHAMVDNMQQIIRHLRAGLSVWTSWPVVRVLWAAPAAAGGMGGGDSASKAGGNGGGSGASASAVSGNEEAETKAHAALHYSEQPWIEVVEKTGESVRAKRVIVAVPVSVLQDEDITFQPPLPTDKLDAARRINMEPCVKLFLRFSQPFWPEELQGVICAECTVPEFWVNEKQPAKGPKEYVLVGFLCADNARRLSAMTRIEARDACLAQLDEMFGATEHNLRHNAAACVRAGGVANPATRAFIDMVIQDWTESPHIRGGYSSPSPFAAAPGADRRALARPVENQLFFCGEATQEVFATMHAALDSGRRAAKEVLDSLRAARDAPPSLKKRASPRSKLAPVTAPRPRM